MFLFRRFEEGGEQAAEESALELADMRPTTRSPPSADPEIAWFIDAIGVASSAFITVDREGALATG